MGAQFVQYVAVALINSRIHTLSKLYELLHIALRSHGFKHGEVKRMLSFATTMNLLKNETIVWWTRGQRSWTPWLGSLAWPGRPIPQNNPIVSLIYPRVKSRCGDKRIARLGFPRNRSRASARVLCECFVVRDKVNCTREYIVCMRGKRPHHNAHPCVSLWLLFYAKNE